MIKGRVDIISLGCSKNLIDSERLMARFRGVGFEVFHDAEKVRGEIVIINTCGFIGDAKEESINMILEVAAMKKRRLVGKVYVMGCLGERYRKELKQEIPEVDGWYGKFDWGGILEHCAGRVCECGEWDRELTTPNHYAYLKIAEGCDRTCSYCAIPLITGKYKSRKVDEILAEAKQLAERGVKELELIAQDLTYYGLDLEHRNMLPELVTKISEIEGIRWIRLHYAYPTHFPYDLLKVMRKNAKVCPYLDVALQHCSDHILSLMRRNICKEETVMFIERLRREVPGICIRTTLMVGHPGETEEDFGELLDFVREMRFERMGAFAYSEEEGTYSAINYKDDVPEEEKKRRLSLLMEEQQVISEEVNRARIGSATDVIIDREEEKWFVGRTGWDSPEVDCEVFVEKNDGIKVGEIYKVEITDASEFELFGKILR
ncbi:MAG: 30S ribosomal protein S12 methylthiotransferase RimO [Paludibacteraceae bacterium]|nr:30S ribosomal protein S12 methylthiotransferase RimO [Paludibacteraceae bacterium]